MWIDDGMAFPGALALWPVAATTLVLVGGALAPNAVTTRGLRLKLLVAIGLISYGWYLWHWPLLTLARIHLLGELDQLGAIAICLLALLIAALSYRYVEKPFRQPADIRPTLQRGAMAGIAVALMATSAGAWAKWWWPQSESNSSLRAALIGTQKVVVPCGQERPYKALNDRTLCTFGDAEAAIVLWGDSHAAHFLPALQHVHSKSIRVRYMPACPPIPDYLPSLVGIDPQMGCEHFNRDVLDEIRATRPATVVLSARWRAYISNAAARDAASKGLQYLSQELAKVGVQVLVMLPPPEVPHSAPACLARRDIVDCSVESAIAMLQREAAVALLRESFAGAELIDPFPTLCPGQSCSPILDGVALYTDAHHLSVAGSQRIGGLIADALR